MLKTKIESDDKFFSKENIYNIKIVYRLWEKHVIYIESCMKMTCPPLKENNSHYKMWKNIFLVVWNVQMVYYASM